jgi:acetyltransferase-like isoleucine patch superfamily enzyme
MLVKLLDIFAARLGRSGYKLDSSFTNSDITELLVLKIVQLLRFIFRKYRFRQSGYINFFGRGLKLSFARNICLGRGVFLGDSVSINALCKSGVSIGNNVTIKSGSTIDCTGVFSELGEGIVIQDRVGISENCFIQVRGKVLIESDVIIGPSVKIFSEDHIFKDPSKKIRKQGTRRLGVTICSGSWIGAGAIILDGVTVGSNSVIAAGSIVTKSVNPRTVVGGNPARCLKLI